MYGRDNFPLRLAKTRLDEHLLKGQINQLTSGTYTLSLSSDALSILSHLTGRRLTESIRRVLHTSLVEILDGSLRSTTPEKQDLLTSTFGELLGVAVRACQIGGALSIVRLIESSRTNSPDFLMMQGGSSSVSFHLLECKGTTEDLPSVIQRNGVSICKKLRQHRNTGALQLKVRDWSAVEFGATIHVLGTFGRYLGIGTKAVTATSVPDGRLMFGRVSAPNVDVSACKSAGRNCLHCIVPAGKARAPLFGTDRYDIANIISVVSVDEFAKVPSDIYEAFWRHYLEISKAEWIEHGSTAARHLSKACSIVHALTEDALASAPVPITGELGAAAKRVRRALAVVLFNAFEHLLARVIPGVRQASQDVLSLMQATVEHPEEMGKYRAVINRLLNVPSSEPELPLGLNLWAALSSLEPNKPFPFEDQSESYGGFAGNIWHTNDGAFHAILSVDLTDANHVFHPADAFAAIPFFDTVELADKARWQDVSISLTDGGGEDGKTSNCAIGWRTSLVDGGKFIDAWASVDGRAGITMKRLTIA